DLAAEEARFLGRHRPGLRLEGELVLLLAADLLELGDVLCRLAHGDVHVGKDSVERGPGGAGGRRSLDRAGFGDGEQFVVGSGIGRSEAVAADRLDPGGDEDVALAGPDGVRGHANGLEGRRAVPVDGHAGHVGEAGQQRAHATQVVAGLATGLAVAEDEVLDRVGIELGHLGQYLAHDQCGQVVGPAVDQRTLVGPSDRGPAGGDDYGFGHVMLLVEGGGAAALVRSWTAVAAGIRQDVPFATYRMVARAVPGGGWMHHAIPPGIRRSVPVALSVPPSDGGATCGLNVTCSSSGRSPLLVTRSGEWTTHGEELRRWVEPTL